MLTMIEWTYCGQISYELFIVDGGNVRSLGRQAEGAQR